MSVQVKGSGTIGGLDEGLVVTGIVTATELDISGNIDVDGHTELDNINISGVSTHVGLSQFQNTINLTHASAGQNYIYFNEDLQFAKNGTGTRLKIDSNGVVGINTDASGNGSGAKLVVGGRVQSNNGGYWFADANGAENGWHVQDSGGNLIIVESGVAERLRIGSSGQIGLGGANYGSSGQVLTSGGSSAAPSWGGGAIPVGGIIMWSGDINNMPKGWRLCDGSGTVNGVAIPDLRNKFVVGSTSDSSGTSYPDVSTGATGTGAYTPAGTIEINKLPLNTIPPHHHFFVGDDQLYNKVCNIDGENCFNNIGGVSTDGTTPSSNNRCVLGYDANSTTGGNKDRRLFKTSKQSCTTDGSNECVQTTANQCKPTGTFSGTSTTILPPYYALAFIIYVGAA